MTATHVHFSTSAGMARPAQLCRAEVQQASRPYQPVANLRTAILIGGPGGISCAAPRPS